MSKRVPFEGRFVLASPNVTPVHARPMGLGLRPVASTLAAWDTHGTGRGLVISPEVFLNDHGVSGHGPGWDERLLRKWALFWDWLDWPANNLVNMGYATPDVEFLMGEGIIRRSRVQMGGSGMMTGQVFLEGHLAAFEALERRQPGAWSVASGAGTIVLPRRALEDGRGLMLRLVDAIPVPAGDVPLADLLEFRVRRRPELLALRNHLEDVYQRIISAGDPNLASLTEFEKLDRSIADQIRVSGESGLKFTLSTLEAKFSVKSLSSGVAAGVATLSTGMPWATAALVGLGVTTYEAVAGLGATVGLKARRQQSSPFQYVSAYRNELPFIGGN